VEESKLRRWLPLLAVAAMVWGTVRFNPIERMIFFPDAELIGTPGHLGLDYDDVHFEAADGSRLHGWFVGGSRPETFLWFHGNAGNISHRIDNLRLLHDRVGASVFLFDYRGYGLSSGRPTETGLFEDARAALTELRQRSDVRADRIVYFGRSLGSAVALDLAIDHPPHGLILETPFTSVRAMVNAILPGPFGRFAPNLFDNLSKVQGLRRPVLFVHGDRDEVVPYPQGVELFDAAPQPKRLHTIHGAGHNDTYLVGGADYFERFREFLDGLEAP
jgi:fermentation-respiration switch protein FrsA (DUF1100 family)